MKKVFTLAAVAVTMVMGLASCQNDSPSSFNAAPQMPTKNQTTTPSTSNTTNNQKSYTFNLSLSDDILALYDVQIAVTAGSESKTFTAADFTKAATLSDGFTPVSYAGKAVAPYTVKADNASVKATFTLKSNWKAVLEGMNKQEYNFYTKYHSSISGAGQKASKCTEEYLKGLADRLSNRISD